MKNSGLKIFSVIIALGLSYYVHSGSESSVIGFISPIEIKNLPQNKMLISPLSPQVRVTIQGPSFFVQRIATSKFTFKVVVPSDVPNRYLLTLNAGDLAIPPPVRILAIDPPDMELIFDTRITKEVPIVVPRLGTLSEGVKLAGISREPSQVTLTGPEHELQSIAKVETEPLDLREVTKTVQQRLRVRVPGTLSTANVQEILVGVNISTIQIEREFQGIPIEVRAASGNSFVVEPARVRVELSGPESVISRLDPVEVRPFVRIEDGQKAGDKVLVELAPPGVASVVLIDPKQVRLVENSATPVSE